MARTNRLNLVTLASTALVLFPSLSIATLALASSSSSSSSEITSPIEKKIMPSSSRPAFPERWGPPPLAQTRDYVLLPGDYGHGSGTLRKWILLKMEEDVANGLGVVGNVEVEDASAATATGRIAATDDDAESSWPKKDLVGMTGQDAKFAVLAGGDGTLIAENVHILPEDSMVTMDYRVDRVRIFVNADGIVVRQPTIG